MSPQLHAQANTSPPASVRSKVLLSPSHGRSPPSRHDPVQPDDEVAVTPKSLSYGARSKTAPIGADAPLWKSSVDRPQLDERDSIFATTYLASDSPASSPRTSSRTLEHIDHAPRHSISDMAAPAPPQRRLIDSPVIRRKQSSGPPIPLNAHHAVLTTHFKSHNPGAAGMEQVDLRHHSPPPFMSPVDSPVQRPTTPHHQVVQATLEEDLQESEERRKNREWREGKPVPFKGSAAPEDPLLDSDMEKKIEATLAKTEQSTARSRKASHYLRVFKDADNEEPKKRDTKPKDRRPTDKLLPRLSEDGFKKNGVKETTAIAEQPHRLSRTPSAIQSPLADHVESYFEKIPTPRSETAPPLLSDTGAIGSLEASSPSKNHLPWRLLEEIRGYGNLTPGALPGSFSRSLPTSAVEKLNAHVTRNQDEPSDYFQDKDEDGADRSPGSDEEDSEREQISSALYFPHRRIKASEQESTERENRKVEVIETGKDVRAGKEPGGWTAEELVQSPQEVEISLQSQDTNQCLYGDLHSTAPVQKEDEQQLITASTDTLSVSAESEVESLAESTHSLQGYESSATDDLGTTPTATTLKEEPKATVAPAPQPPAPLGAVELKPYDHQVGGHSTVYRFSKRAVCKQLNNRENEFYETVEREHPELLEFLPRYVLAVGI